MLLLTLNIKRILKKFRNNCENTQRPYQQKSRGWDMQSPQSHIENCLPLCL